MAKQTINVGTGPNTGTGEAVRTAFIKVNDNFTEVYGIAQSAYDAANSAGGGGGDTGDITFDGTTISAPNGSDILVQVKNSSGNVNASLKLDAEYSAARLDAKTSDDRQFYQGEFGDYATGSWQTQNGQATLSLTGATTFINFKDNDPEWRAAGDRETGEFSLDGTTWYQWPYSSSSSGEGQISVTFYDESFTPNDPIAVETFYLRWINNSYITVDQEDYSEVKIVGAGVGVKIEGTNSVNIEAGDSINFEAQRSIALQTIGTDPVRIQTDIYGNQKTWEFRTNGNLSLPQGGTIIEGVVTDNPTIELTPANPTVESQKLIIKGGQEDNYHLHLTTGDLVETSVFLGTDEHNVRTYPDGSIQITSYNYIAETPESKSWTFDTIGQIFFPDGTLQFTAWGGGRVRTFAPETSKGSEGDKEKDLVFDNSYIYYCTADYTDGQADIWKRVAWSNDTW